MRTPNDVQREMRSTRRELPAAPAGLAEHPGDEGTTLSEMTGDSPVWVIDFLETRDRLMKGFEDSSKEFGINGRASKIAGRRLPPVKRGDRLQESLYWLFTAALLGYLLLEIIGR
jgi:hypothetical protein